MTNPVKIRVENVSKIFGPDPVAALAKVNAGMGKTELLEDSNHVVGLHDINLTIRAGETFVIMGLSGSGKSTLIRHFNRLIEPTAGRILVDDVDVLSLNASDLRAFRRKKISMVFQRFALLPHKTVLENVIYGLVIDGMPKAEARAKGAEQVAQVGLAGFENHYPGQLSGGMQQRVGLARALATDAEILLMDEAFSALDPLIRHDMQLQLRDIQARLHKTIVFITHDLDEALLLGDHIAILKDGLLRQVGTGAEILVAPADDYVARFVRDVNRARIITCGALAVPGVGVGDVVLEAGQTVETAFAALAASDAPITVRHADGKPAGVLTRELVLGALARS
jgi:glycine betaine/proline transport system ATP-binding protein